MSSGKFFLHAFYQLILSKLNYFSVKTTTASVFFFVGNRVFVGGMIDSVFKLV